MSALRSLATLAATTTFFAGAGVTATSLLRDPSAKVTLSTVQLGTPVMSVRRAPTLLADTIGSAQLRAAVQTAFDSQPFDGVEERSCIYAELSGPGQSRPLLAITPSREVIPASTLKVLTGATALSVMDPNERFVTTLRVTTQPSGGVLAGDLWIVGGGDPLLETRPYSLSKKHRGDVTTPIEQLADAVVAAGITTITGKIVGDDRLFDDVRTPPTWKKSYVAQGEVGPVGGLLIDDNFTVLSARNKPIAATDVPKNAAEAFQRLLEERGVTVTGVAEGATRTIPDAATSAPIEFAKVESIPLVEVVGEMLRESDNTTAEVLLKHIGLRSGGDASTASGASAVKRSLQNRGVPETDRNIVRMVDGSGLDRGDRLNCAVLVEMLRGQAIGSNFINGFAVMGKSGTLAERLRKSPAAGRVWGKTGTLNGVSALTGIAQSLSGREVRFAMILNGLASTGSGVTLGNQISEALVTFPGSIALSVLAPVGASIPTADTGNVPTVAAEPTELPAAFQTVVPDATDAAETPSSAPSATDLPANTTASGIDTVVVEEVPSETTTTKS